MRKYRVDEDITLAYISVNQYSEYKNAVRNSSELRKHSFIFTEMRRDYFNDKNMIVCELANYYSEGYLDICKKEGLNWVVELFKMKCENE